MTACRTRNTSSSPRTPVGAKPRIRGHRITVQDIAIWYERIGKSATEIAAEYDLTLADVHAALTYYFDHREEIDARMAEDRAFAEALRARTPSLRDQSSARGAVRIRPSPVAIG